MRWLDVAQEMAGGRYPYWLCVGLMMIGFYIVIIRGNLIKKLIGLNIFQTAVIIFYVSMGKIDTGTVPVLIASDTPVVYSNPLPSVLMLTAIVVGVATTSVGLAIVIRIKEAYGSIEEEDIIAAQNRDEAEEEARYAALTSGTRDSEAQARGQARGGSA